MSEEIGLFDAIYHCRAMRKLEPTPVPEELLVKLIDAANQAPSGSNRQGARWIVVRDKEQRAKLAEMNKAAVNAYILPSSGRADSLPHQDAAKRQRMLNAVLWQADNMQNIPVLIIACMEFDAPVNSATMGMGGGSMWPAIQNLLLAARALGLGAAPTTLALQHREQVNEVLNLPDNMGAFCLIPVGYPKGKFGPVTRLPVEETMRWDRWS